MPTTQEEAARIVDISMEFLPIDKLAELFIKLDDEVGKRTDNDSLKVSLQMMRALMEGYADAKSREAPPWWLVKVYYLLVFVHAALVIGLGFCFVGLPFMVEWYLALPLCVFIWFFSTSQFDCKLTNLENHMRRRLGMRRIGGFVGHYFVKPVKKMWYNS